MHIFWARSRKRAPPHSRDSVTWSCHTRGRREGGRQEEVAPGRACGWPGRGQAEGGPRAGRVEGETSPTKQAQARKASSHGPQTSPRLRRGHASPFLPAPSATPGNPRGPSSERHNLTQTKGPMAEFSRERNLPPTPHATRLIISRDLRGVSAQSAVCPPEGAGRRRTFFPELWITVLLSLLNKSD